MATSPDEPKFRQSVAVVIGINDYGQGIARLQSAVNDATRLAALLAEQHGYQVQLLVDQVTRARLAALFEQELPASLGADDRLLVYFAGHGVADDGDDGPAGYLLPQDAHADDPATFVAMTALNGWLNALPCRHLLLILDCCFAGAFRWSAVRQLRLKARPLYRERYERFIRDPAWQVLTSAAFDQTAADLLSRLGTRPDDGNHSPFALALFDALAGRADLLVASDQGAPQGDGVITAPELYLYVRDQLDPGTSTGEQRQTPGLWPLHRHGKGEYIFLVPGRQPDLPPAPALTPANNPYRGLEPYNEEHQALFFGRDELVKALASVVETHPFTVVTGVSGSGKSSLVRAGLIPQLRHAPEQKSDDPAGEWQILGPIRPGAKPLQALAALFGQEPQDHTPDTFDLGANDLVANVQSALAAYPGKRLLLIIDQFEELVTLTGEQARAQVVQQLAALLANPDPALHIVLTVRSDFEPHFASGPLKQPWAAGRFVVTSMTQDELREIIVQPAAARVLTFEPDELVDRIINDVVQMPGALPLLSFTMSELYLRYLARRSDDRAMTAADYDALGGVAGALRTRATAEYDALDPLQQKSMQRLLLRMVALEGAELARRRVSRDELDYATPGENERVNEVIQRLTAARLLVTGQDESGKPYVEPAHDALIQAWDKLWSWVHAEQEQLLLQRRLTPAAMDWVRGGRAIGLLWDNDPRLRQADAARSAPESWLNRVESEFVAASVQRRQLNQRRLISSLVAAVIIFAFLAGFAFIQRNNAIDQSNARATQEAIAITQRNEAERQSAISRSRELAVVAQTQLDVDPERAILVALEANTITRTFESEDVLRRAIRSSALRATFGDEQTELLSADISADRLMLSGIHTSSAFLQLLDLATRQPLAEFNDAQAAYLYDARFSPDGRRVVALGDDAFVRVWDVESGALLLKAPGHSATWSPDGTAIATAGDNLAADVWDVEAGQLRATVGERDEGIYEQIHFSPDGQRLVTTYGYLAAGATTRAYRAKVWELATGEMVTEFAINRDVSFSPDGLLLAHGDGSTAMLRDGLTYAEIQPVTSQNLQTVLYQRFSPTGHYLVTGSTDSTIRIWQIDTEITRIILVRVTDQTNLDTGAELAEFSPDERTLVTVSGPEMRLWDIQSGDLLATLRHGERRVHSVRFTPDGRYLLSASDDGTVRLWSARLGEEWLMVPGNTAHFSPDSAQMAVAMDHRVQLWDLATQLPVPLLFERDAGENDAPIRETFFSPNGERLYAVDDAAVTWWDRVSGQPVGALQVISGTLMAVALSPNEQTVATVTHVDRETEDIFDPNRDLFLVDLWAAANGTTTVALQDLPNFRTVDNIAFSADGTALLVSGPTSITEAGGNRLVRVWDVATGALRYGLDFPRATRAQFSSDGEQLVTVNQDEIALWRAADGSNLAHIPAGAVPLSAETMSFSADGRRMIVPDGFSSTARLWDLEAQQSLFSLNGHSARIAQLQLTPDGNLILTISPGDRSIRLWDGTNGTQLTLLPQWADHAELSADGRYLLAAENGSVGLHPARFDDLLALARSRVTRSLSCEEARDFLHSEDECTVVAPPPARS